MVRAITAALAAKRAMRAMERAEENQDFSEVSRAIEHWREAHEARPADAFVRRFYAQALLARAEGTKSAEDARRALALIEPLPPADSAAEYLRVIATTELAVIEGDEPTLRRGIALCKELRARPRVLPGIVAECLASEIGAHRALARVTRDEREMRRARELVPLLAAYAPELARDLERGVRDP
ncbi:MAG: hypothetical protein ACYDCK_07175 [Thermoplasmatota archaeon]